MQCIKMHFRTCPSFWPYPAPTKVSWRHNKQFKSFRIDKQTHKQMDTTKNIQFRYAIAALVVNMPPRYAIAA